MLKLYNTLSRKKEIFKPPKDKKVGIYTCGPTVYDYAHIGNLRAYISADLLQRYLKYRGYKVKWVMNITDIDDKTIKGANEKGINLDKYTRTFKEAFFKDLKSLNIEKADIYPEATKHIPEMVGLVKKILNRGIAYIKDDSVYFDISKLPKYDFITPGVELKEKPEGSKIQGITEDEYDRLDVRDFVLWKAKKDNEPSWKTEIGEGRPGWHLECSAMSKKYLGQPFDIHTGGVDLIFPHHHNEIAQSRASENKDLANFWIHNEHLLIDGRKMSKSLNNFYTLGDIEKKDSAILALRYFYLSGHYRDKLNFTPEGLKSAENTLNNLYDFVGRINEIEKEGKLNNKVVQITEKAEKEFGESLDDDLNAPKALASIFNMIKEINKIGFDALTKKDSEIIYKVFLEFDSVLGLELAEKSKIKNKASEKILKLIDDREVARKKKDFKKADQIRQELLEKGIELEDTLSGVHWKRVDKK